MGTLYAKRGNTSIEARAPTFYTDFTLLPVSGDADPSLAIISQQPNDAKTGPRHPIGNLGKYACDPKQGEGVTLYIVDSQFQYLSGMDQLQAVSSDLSQP